MTKTPTVESEFFFTTKERPPSRAINQHKARAMEESELRARLDALDGTLDAIDGQLAPVIAALSDPSGARPAGLQLAAGYSLLSLFFMFSRTQGVNVEDQPVKRELERMKGYFRKMKAAQQRKQSRKRAREEADARAGAGGASGAGQSVVEMRQEMMREGGEKKGVARAPRHQRGAGARTAGQRKKRKTGGKKKGGKKRR